ncbi:MAG: hypothetical protein JNK76_00720 [Planctomycetales bacterium]|nr:hypothetical protein [Planctomycetales bacterium]MBN8625702.1 hypothetical protein [Planctomycetota bacterium]
MNLRSVNLRLFFGLALCAIAPLAVGCSAEAWGHRAAGKPSGYTAVEAGMSEAQVRKIMGEPKSRSGVQLEGSKQPAVVLRYLGHQSLMHITLVNDKVIGKEKI